MEPQPNSKKRRGFAVMDQAKRRAIASLGGVAVHRQGKGHQFTSDSARLAGMKGGAAPHGRKRELRGPVLDAAVESVLRATRKE